MTVKLISQSRRAAIRAGANPESVKPLTICATIQISAALIIKVKSPSVKILIGRVRIIRIGFMRAFKIPKNRATIRAVVKLLTLKPGTSVATTKMASAEKTQLAKSSNMTLLILS